MNEQQFGVFVLSDHPPRQMNGTQPIDYETAWGEPEPIGIGAMTEPVSSSICPYEQIECLYWGKEGCFVDVCVITGDMD
jgi:hypothetical protein